MPDGEVIIYGIKWLNEQRVLRANYAEQAGSAADAKLAAENQLTLEAIVRGAPMPLSLTGLLAFARNYQLSN